MLDEAQWAGVNVGLVVGGLALGYLHPGFLVFSGVGVLGLLVLRGVCS